MDIATTLVYDGSFNGFLSCIYAAFERKSKDVSIKKSKSGEQQLFAKEQYVPTNVALAKLVWNGISQKNHTAIKTIYFAFLSEAEGVELLLYRYVRYVMGVLPAAEIPQLQQTSLILNSLADKVEKEKRRLEAFVSFQLLEDKVYVAGVKPKYNVLPLLSKHLKTVFKDMEWHIYDLKRNFGIYFSQGKLEVTSGMPKMSQAV